MEINVSSLLKATKLFSSLNEAALKTVARKLHQLHLKKNKYLFCQGELSDGIFLVAHGKLVAILKTQYNEKKVLSEIRVGETVGEIGALSHEPRSASVKALEDSIVFKLTREDFLELCNQYPPMLVQIMDILSSRSRNLIELLSAREPAKRHLAIVPANKKTHLGELAASLQAISNEFPGVTVLSDYDEALTTNYKTRTQWRDYIQSLDTKKNKIIYVLHIKPSPLKQVCLENVDMIYVAGTGHTKAYLNPNIHKMLHDEELTYKAKPELILLYANDDGRLPTNTMQWLKCTDFNFHHQIRLYRKQDLQRLMRFITGQAVGVVLGGGGARSWAHIGAVQALIENNIPIDMICGTSGGAIVAGYYALNESIKDSKHMLSQLNAITYKAVTFRYITWPAVSLFSGERFTEKQQEIFGNHKIEDLWIPFFCVSCNLSKSSAVIHSKGKLWKKVRASTSVPGVFPPVVINGQLHLDGGIVNNLPVDLLKKSSSSINLTIAVELIHVKQKDIEYNFPPILPLGKTFLAKMGLAYKQLRFPSFVDTFLKSLLAGSSAKQNENALAADVLISPTLSGFDLLRVPQKQEKELIKIGYKATLEALKHPKKKTTRRPKIKGRVPLHTTHEKYKPRKVKSKVK